MVRWVVNILYSMICVYCLVDAIIMKNLALIILMTPYILLQILQIVLLLTNKHPIKGADNWVEIIVPVIGASWPIIISFILKPTFISGYPMLVGLGSLLIIFLYFIEFVTLLNLRYSFSILPEARKIVKSGPYKYVRHPLYSLYIIWAILNVILTMNFFYFLFGMLPLVVFLTIRARMEEKKLTQNLDEYEIYMQETGMFFPKFKKEKTVSQMG